jgi:hypothetical protein
MGHFCFMQTINLREVLDIIDSGLPFNLKYCTYSRTRGTGGEMIERRGWTKAIAEKLPPVVLIKNGIKNSRDPRHSHWKTRLIYNAREQQLRKLYIKLITEFNGKKVV